MNKNIGVDDHFSKQITVRFDAPKPHGAVRIEIEVVA